MNKKVTVYDIAKELGISPSTVSRVLNNSSLIGDEKKELILSTAQRMNYQKRPIKKQRGRAIINIRLFLPPAKYSYIHLFYDITELLSSIQQGFGDTRINVITSINDGNISLFDSKKLGDIDGIVFAFTQPCPRLEELLEERDIPFILLNRSHPEHNYVIVDSQTGMKHLIEALYRRRGKELRPCFIGFSPLAQVSSQRAHGVMQSCKALDIPFSDKDIINIESLLDLREDVLPAIKSNHYNAVLCFNDLLALSMYQSILHLGKKIPEYFSLTGFDNSPVLQLLDQKIDTVEFSLTKLGQEAGKWLNKRIIERDEAPLQLALEGIHIIGETI